MNTEKIINKISSLFLASPISPRDQQLLFLWTRHLLENESVKRNYPLVLLYCNWSLHIEIDRDPECGPIILGISNALAKIDTHKSTQVATISIYQSLKLKELISQFKQLFLDYSLPLTLFEPPNHEHFLNQLIKVVLLDKPIILNKNGKSKQYYDELTNSTIGARLLTMASVHFEYFTDYGSPTDPRFSTYCAVCKNRDDVRLCLPIDFDLWDNIFNEE